MTPSTRPIVCARLILLVCVTTLAAGCASSGAVPRPFPGAPAPSDRARAGGAATDAIVPPAPLEGYAITSTALALRGIPYRNGGADPSGFDCSGLVKYVFEQHGVVLPRDTRSQFAIGEDVAPSALAPGDLVFFTTVAPGASHVGIVIGGDQFVHAPSSSGVVRVEHLGAAYWANRFVGAKRVTP